jgi:MscS family membrane protein
MKDLVALTLRLCIGLTLAGVPARALAQGVSPSAEPSGPAPTAASAAPVDPDSPRASITRFLDLTRRRQYDEAAAYLAVSETQRPRAAELARYLKAVLDRHLWVDLERMSPRSAGDEKDGLPAGMDEVGLLPGPEPVRMVKLEGVTDARWVFSNGTVSRIDYWYASLTDRWIREHAPEVLLRTGPKELLWWQWIAVFGIGVLAIAGGKLLKLPVAFLLRRVFSKTRTTWDDALLERSGGPLTLLLGVAVAWSVVPSLELYEPAWQFVRGVLRALGLVAIFWALWRSVDVVESALRGSAWNQGAATRSLVSLAGGLTKVFVASLGLIAALSELGYPVSGLLAGLGIGGLALALAAQKTGENLFGSLSLALDRPFDVGEFVKVEDFVGHVESVGLRSTRFRTPDRTLITIPNGRVADLKLENYTVRDRLRLACAIGLVHGTTAAQVRQVLEGVEQILRSHPKVWPDAIAVRLKELGPVSLDIEVNVWFQTTDWSEFQLIRQDVLLQIMDVVEGVGTTFAYPTHTVQRIGEPSPPPPGRAIPRG